LEKKLSSQALELKATQDDLAKAKASVETTRAEIKNLEHQRDEALREAKMIAANPPAGQAEELERLKQELSNAKDEEIALRETLALTKSSIEEMAANHSKDLEEAAKVRAEESIRLHASHDGEVHALVAQKTELLVKFSDLEGELATLKASISAEANTPKTNGAPRSASPGVSETELHQMHQAHNLKLYDLQAEHEREMKEIKEQLDKAFARVDELEQTLARRDMEIKYLERDQEETQDEITTSVDLS